MNGRGVVLVMVAILGLTLALMPGLARAQACPQPPNAERLRAELMSLVNAQRVQAGLPRLAHAPRLDQAAQRIACDNAARDRLSHTGNDGSDLRARLRAAGYRFRSANENLTQRRGGPAAAVQSWMASPVHRANLLDRRSRDYGGAVARAASGQLYWAMVTAVPR